MDETENDDWTPLKGWTKAAIQIPLRTVAAAIVCWRMFGLLYGLIRYMESELTMKITLIHNGLIIFFAIIGGFIAGKILSYKLAETTGLLSKFLAPPVVLVFFCGMFGMYQIAAEISSSWRFIILYLFAVSAIAAAATAWRQFIKDA